MTTITTEDICAELEAYESEQAKPSPTHVGERFIRFMGADEFYALIEGKELEQHTDHSKKSRTNSKGFCFLRLGDEWDRWGHEGEEASIEEAHRFLSGIVSDFAAVVFVNESASLKDGCGTYADPYDDDWYARIYVDEFSTTSYDRESMRPVRAYLHIERYSRPFCTETIEF